MCPACHKNEAKIHQSLGVLPCDPCQLRQSRLHRPGKLPEFTSESIKQQRKEYANDVEQPHYKGHLNKKFIDIYGEKAALDRGFSKKEVKSAVYINTSDKYYNDY